MDFDDNRHNDTRIHQEYNDISPTCPDEEVYPASVIELPIAKEGKVYIDLIIYEYQMFDNASLV
jgi:hypothetical protein